MSTTWNLRINLIINKVKESIPIHRLRLLNSANGFTLLEIMVAISILSIVLIAIFKMHSQTITMNNMAKFYSTAPFLAQHQLSKVKMKDLNDQTSASGDFENEYPGYNWHADISDVESEVLGIAAQNLKKIDVTIKFNADEFSYNLTTYSTFWE